MARKKITSLVGNDPEYSKEFTDTPSAPVQTPKAETPVQPIPLAKESPKPKPRARQKKPAKVPSPKVIPEPASKAKPKTRAVHVRAAPKSDHKPGLDALQKAGLPSSDVVRLAGKRAIAKFELKSNYVAPQEADRLPSDMSFRTMKTLDGKTLDALRDQADPLRLRSDASVIQGQLEPIFWEELDAVISELRKKYP
jgi:hypothetical protein